MKIKLTTVYVDDQEKALRFYTEVLGFAKKADFSQGPFRWLTVARGPGRHGAATPMTIPILDVSLGQRVRSTAS
jgi:catechol 2,3-dioxygenase-like lactoylglutathione lyase family enzyme